MKSEEEWDQGLIWEEIPLVKKTKQKQIYFLFIHLKKKNRAIPQPFFQIYFKTFYVYVWSKD